MELLALCLVATLGETPNSLDLISGDMTLAHEAKLSGVPDSYDWAKKPRVGMGNKPGEWTAFVPWGQLFVADGGNPASNTLVEIRRLRGYVLSRKTGKWNLISDSDKEGIQGAHYVENFAKDANKPAGEKFVGKGVIVTSGGGYTYHFWPKSGRVAIDPSDIAGVFTTCQARLVQADPAKPDDRAKARYLLSIGGDYWKDLTAQWDNFKTNNDVGIGRFRFVKADWGWFNMTTLSAEELRKNPPPL